MKTDELVINFHITPACNFKCKYCYASWENVADRVKGIWMDEQRLMSMLRILYQHFTSLGYDKIRLTIAGGEPLLVRNLGSVLRIADEIGFSLSIITNGYLLTVANVMEMGRFVSVLGISVDSVNTETLTKIGRIDRAGKIINFHQLENAIRHFRVINQEGKLKINTVINQYNCTEDLSSMVETLAPDRWKILRVLPNVQLEQAISDADFYGFLKNHERFSDIWTVEDNEDMIGSYIKIDPNGRFFDNSEKLTGYTYSDPILDVGVKKAFSQVGFDKEKFRSRYAGAVTA